MNTPSPASPTDPTLDTVEDLDYDQGGFHPVHLGDSFDNNHYRVIHKLGYGGYATVWLAQDNKRHRYVALKILAARVSDHSPEVNIARLMKDSPNHQGKANVNLPLNYFFHTGPNGNHLCLISYVCGPSLRNFTTSSQQYDGGRQLEASIARSISLQVVHGLTYIHHTNIIHGDLTPANVLLELANIDHWTEQDVYQRLGTPHKQYLLHTDLITLTSTLPAYTVPSINMLNVSSVWLSPSPKIIDFGVALHHGVSSLAMGTPKSYRAPELLFHSSRSKASDVWALGCLLFEIRTGRPLFAFNSHTTRSKMMLIWVEVLGGHLPDEWQPKFGPRDVHPRSTEEPTNLLLQRIMNGGAQEDDTTPNSPSPSPSNQANTDQLVSMVMGFTTSEAEEVLRLVKLPNQNRLDVNIPEHASSAQNSGEPTFSGRSSNHLTRMQSPIAHANTHPAGVMTLPALHRSPIEGVTPPVTNVNWQCSPHNNQTFLDSKGSKISAEEAVSLEGLIRSCLEFQPDDRILTSDISNHAWFSTIFPTTSHSAT